MTYIPIQREPLMRELREHVIEIVYDDVDNTRCVVKATLQHRYLPEGFDLNLLTSDKDVAAREGKLSVWSVEQRNWLAFPLNRVVSMQLLMAYY